MDNSMVNDLLGQRGREGVVYLKLVATHLFRAEG